MTNRMKYRKYIRNCIVCMTIFMLAVLGTFTLSLTNTAGEGDLHDNRAHALDLPTYEDFNFNGKRNLISLTDFDTLHISGSSFALTAPYSNVNTYYITINDALELYAFSYRANGRLSTGSILPNASALSFYPRARYILGDNIDFSSLSAEGFVTIGSVDNPFTGEFDGQGFEVRNLTIDTNPARTNATVFFTMFGYNNGTVKNLGVITTGWTASGMFATSYMSALVGSNSGTVLNCYAQTGANTLTADMVAGLVYNNMPAGNITNSYFAGRLSGTTTGALVAVNAAGATVVNSCYDSALHAVSAAGTGVATALLQAMTGVLATADGVYYLHTATYPKLYGIKNSRIYRPADLVYFPIYIDSNASATIMLANCIDMSAVSEKAYTPNTTAFTGSLSSDASGACPIAHPAGADALGVSHSIINLRITNYVLTAASNYAAGLLITTTNARVSNLNFIGGFVRLPALDKSSQTLESVFSAGMLIGRHIANGILTVTNIHSSANVFSAELDSTGNYSVIGMRLNLGGIIGSAGYASTTVISNVSCNGTIYGGTHTTYRSGTTKTILAAGGIFGAFGGNAATTAPVIRNITFSGTVYGGRVFKIENGTGDKIPGMYAAGILAYSETYLNTRQGGIVNNGEVYSGPLNLISENPNRYPNPNNKFIASSGGRTPDVSMETTQATTTGPAGAQIATGGVFGRNPQGDWSGSVADSLRNDGDVYCIEYQGYITVGGASRMLAYSYGTGGIAGTSEVTWTVNGLHKNGNVSVYNPGKTPTLASHGFAGFVGSTATTPAAVTFNDCYLDDPVIMDSYAYGTTTAHAGEGVTTSNTIGISGFAYYCGAINSSLKKPASTSSDAGKIQFRTNTNQMAASLTVSKLTISAFSSSDSTTYSGCVFTNSISNGELIVGNAGQIQYIDTVRISGFSNRVYSANSIANSTTLTVNAQLALLASTTSGTGLTVGGICAYGRAMNNAINTSDINIGGWLTTDRMPLVEAGGISGLTIASDFDNVINTGNITLPISPSSPAITTAGTLRAGGIFGTDATAGYKTRLINKGNIVINYADSGRSGTSYIGGIAGYVSANSSYWELFNTGNITFQNSYAGVTAYTGGIFGYFALGAYVADSVNAGAITHNTGVTVSSSTSTGGIVGNSAATVGIYNCMNFGKISGIYNTGGIAGIISAGVLNNCINYGEIAAAANASVNVRLGGLAGSTSVSSRNLVNYGTVNTATYSGTISGNRTGGSFYNLLSVYSGSGTANLFRNTTDASAADASTSASTQPGAIGGAYYPRTDAPGGIYNSTFFLRANSTLQQLLVYSDIANSDGFVGAYATPQTGTGYPMLYVITTSGGRANAYYLFENFTAYSFSAGDFNAAAVISEINSSAHYYDQIKWPSDCEIMYLSLRDRSSNGMRVLTEEEAVLESIETPTESKGTITYILTTEDTIGKGTDTTIANIEYVINTIDRSNRSTSSALMSDPELTTPLVITIDKTSGDTVTYVGYIEIRQTYGAQVYTKLWTINIIYTPTVKRLIVTDIQMRGTDATPTTPGILTGLFSVTEANGDYVYDVTTEGVTPKIEMYAIKDRSTDRPAQEVYYSGGELRVSFDTISFYETESIRAYTKLYNDSGAEVTTGLSWVAGATNGIVTNTATTVEGITVGKVYIHLAFATTVVSGRYTIRVAGIAVYSDIYIQFTKEKNRDSAITGTTVPYIVGGYIAITAFSYNNTAVNNEVAATSTTTFRYGDFIDLSVFNSSSGVLFSTTQAISFLRGVTLSNRAALVSNIPTISVAYKPDPDDPNNPDKIIKYHTRTIVIKFAVRAEAYDESQSPEYNAQYYRNYTITLNEADPVTTVSYAFIDGVQTYFPSGNISIDVERTGRFGNISILYSNTNEVDIRSAPTVLGVYNRVGADAVVIEKEGAPYLPEGSEVPPVITTGKIATSTGTQVNALLDRQTSGGLYTFTPTVEELSRTYNYTFGDYDFQFYGVRTDTLVLDWAAYSLGAFTVEKLASKDAYITNIGFQLDPSYVDIKDVTANLTPELLHRGLIVGSVNIDRNPDGTPASNYSKVTYTSFDYYYFMPSHPDRCTDFEVTAMYSSDGLSMDNIVNLTPPIGATLEMWDEGTGEWIRLAYYDEDDVLQLDNGGFRMLPEGIMNRFRVIAENTSYRTYYSVQLGGAPQIKSITVITRVPEGFTQHLIFQMFTLIQQPEGLVVTRTTSFTYSAKGATLGAGADAGYMVKTHGFINHIPAYYSIGCIVPLGYKYSVSAWNLDGTKNMLVVDGEGKIKLDQFGRPYMDLRELTLESSIIVITILPGDSPEWGLYTERIT